MDHHMDGGAAVGDADQSFTAAFVVVPSLLLCGGLLGNAIYTDTKEGRDRQSAKSGVDQSLRSAMRFTFLLGGLINVLSLSITNPSFFSTSTFSAAAFFRADTAVVKNMLHGCFLLGGFTNWTQTGNPRYVTLILVILACILSSSAVAIIISLYQWFLFGSGRVALQACTSLVMAALCVTCGLLIRTARDFSMRAASTLFPALGRQQLSQQAQQVIDTCLGPRRASDYADLRTVTRSLIMGEGLLFGVAGFVFLVLRLGIASDAPLPFSQFVHGFVGAYTMAIHVGWLLGNGLHAVNANSLESLNLFMWAKFVFGALAWLEALSMLGLSSLGSPTQLRFSVLFSTMLGAIQIWSFICIRRMQATLAEIHFTDDAQYVPSGGSVASSFGFSVLSLAKVERLSPQLRARAHRAGVWALLSAALFQAQCIAMAWLDPTTRSIFPAFNFGLHFAAIFMLTFYRSVQDYEQRLRKRTISLQACVFGVYALGPLAQMIAALLGGPALGAWSADMRGVFAFNAARCAVNAVASWYFFQLRVLPGDQVMPGDAAAETGAAAAVSEVALVGSKADEVDDATLLHAGGKEKDKDRGRDRGSSRERKRPSAATSASAAAVAAAGDGDGDAETHALLASSEDRERGGGSEMVVNASMDASAGVARLDSRDRVWFSLGEWTVRGYLTAFTMLCVAVVVTDASDDLDLRGFFGPHWTVADIATHSDSYHIAFHFCFLLLGYTKRGYDSANVMFLQFASFTGGSIVLTLSSAFASRWLSAAAAEGQQPPLSAPWAGVLTVVHLATLANALVLQAISRVVQRNAGLFPQNTHAMV